MANHSDDSYSDYYLKQEVRVYPSEFVIRTFLGNYPEHRIDRRALPGKRILDLGFGDGRNIPLLADLGFEVHGVEVTNLICELITQRMNHMGVKLEAKVGRNCQIPYADAYFDYVLASSSCYYIDRGATYADNLKEIARVIKPGGMFVHSLPMATTFIMEGAKDLGNGHMEITQDPYGVRVGAILKKFDTPIEIEDYLTPNFADIRIGSCRDDYWGSKVHLWLVVCTRR
jgi:ubiquinone/menaquinone biosynthesis C-methylase UbiE